MKVCAPIFFSNFAFQHFQNFAPSLVNNNSCSSFEYLSFVSASARRMACLYARLSLLRLELQPLTYRSASCLPQITRVNSLRL